jgi:hypothetical protein
VAVGIPFNCNVRSTGTVTGTLGTAMSLAYPVGVGWHPTHGLTVVETWAHRVHLLGHDLRMRHVAGTGSQGAGADGIAATASDLYAPWHATWAPNGDMVICDTYNHRVRRVVMATGIITTIAGVCATGARGAGPVDGIHWRSFSGPSCRPGPSCNASIPHMTLCVPRGARRSVASISVPPSCAGVMPGGGIAGNGGPATSARLWSPVAVSFFSNGDYVSVCCVGWVVMATA